jgi:hypothetical protein|tara:strand:- start:87 stop:293 length:207 start_codon:yes stop_codon:yes gene_type:complete
MALENKTVLENLTKQREEVISQIETARTTLLKLDGAIDVLTQIEEANAQEAEETAAPAETEVVEETYE